MAKTKNEQEGYGKILDSWTAPKGVGAPIGCISTSYTFNSAFFEEECLSRFLSIESDPYEERKAYFIELESKLSQVACAAALVDGHHCRGARSLRWDLVPIRTRGGILHAKISLLCWNSCIRMIIASANLTEDGYRRNLEIFGTLDYFPKSDAPLTCLRESLSFLRNMIALGSTQEGASSPAQKRVHWLLSHVERISTDWGSDSAAKQNPRMFTLFTGPGRASVFEQFAEIWPRGTRPDMAGVVSPFFDNNKTNLPAQSLWEFLRQRGKTEVSYYVCTEPIDQDRGLYIHAPESLKFVKPKRSSAYTRFCSINKEPHRPLHAKCLWMDRSDWDLYMIGSSNFTPSGYGLVKNCNWEANLIYLTDVEKDKQAFQKIKKSFPKYEEIHLEDQPIQWIPPRNLDEEPETEEPVLPLAFDQATYTRNEQGQFFIVFTLAGIPPADWSLQFEEQEEHFYHERLWQDVGQPMQFELPWTFHRSPSGFAVHWAGAPAPAWWPVSITSQQTLPPPDELQNLTLEDLIAILTSANPLRQMNRILLKKEMEIKKEIDILIDPHKRVDTSRFLLQRTRRVSQALQALRERLERPYSTKEAMHWRLHGPYGVTAVADALMREASSEEEKGFLLSELALELSRVQPQSLPGGVSHQEVQEELRLIMVQLHEQVLIDTQYQIPNLNRYIHDVFQVILQ